MQPKIQKEASGAQSFSRSFGWLLSAAARPGTTFRLRRSRGWRCGSCPGTKVDQAQIADVLAGLGELPARPDALLAVRLPAWPHRWQSRRTAGDRHLLGD